MTATQPLSSAQLPALAVGPRRALLVDGHGVIEEMSHAAARRRLSRDAAMVCNQAVVARRIGLTAPRLYDVLELFLFTRPAAPVLPNVRGLAGALGLARPEPLEDEALTLHRAANVLLDELASPAYGMSDGAAAIARDMTMAGWPWGPLVTQALAHHQPRRAREVWDALPEWEDDAPSPPPGTAPVTEDEAEARLRSILGRNYPGGAEDRPAQFTYARAAAGAFAPPNRERAPKVVLAEAGTGTGKTLGYVAPASLWAEKNGGAV
ncbi:MAG: ATP-dependent DNA helicase, partial [Sphingomonadales bacterium]